MKPANITITSLTCLALMASVGTVHAADLVMSDDVLEGPWVDGIVSFALGMGVVESDDGDWDSDSAGTLKMDARIRLGLDEGTDGMSLQLESKSFAQGSYESEDNKLAEGYIVSTMLGGHVFHRAAEENAFGAFASYAITGHNDSRDHSGTAIAGAEFAQFFDNSTIVVQAGGAWDLMNNDDEDFIEGWNDGWFVRGVARYFLNPKAKI